MPVIAQGPIQNHSSSGSRGTKDLQSGCNLGCAPLKKPQHPGRSVFPFAAWWRHSCYFVDDIHWDLTAPILPFYSQKLDLLRRSLDFTSLNGETGFRKDLNYFLPFLKNFLHCVSLYNDSIDVLQMFWGFTLFQCSLD